VRDWFAEGVTEQNKEQVQVWHKGGRGTTIALLNHAEAILGNGPDGVFFLGDPVYRRLSRLPINPIQAVQPQKGHNPSLFTNQSAAP
jgi:hypothetical protein